MEADEDNYGSTNLKRQRAPLSDSEENVFLPSGLFCFNSLLVCTSVNLNCKIFPIIVPGCHVSGLHNFLFCLSEVRDSQKRRRLEAAGQENQNPKPTCSRRLEQETKPDTPMVPSIRSRVLQLTQRPDGKSTRFESLCEFCYGS